MIIIEMSKFLQNLKSLCILFDKEATFTTAVNQFKLVKSGLETLDAAIANAKKVQQQIKVLTR